MRGFVSKLALSLRLVFLPLVVLVAFALIAFGVSLIYFPAGLIVGGLLLVIAAIDARG